MKLITYRDGLTVMDLISPLLSAHSSEVYHDPAPCPDRTAYAEVSAAGGFFGVVAYADGGVVGYITAMIFAPIHKVTDIRCVLDTIYVMPKYRGSQVAGRLWRDLRIAVKASGATHIQVGAPVGSELDKALSARHTVDEHVYTINI